MLPKLDVYRLSETAQLPDYVDDPMVPGMRLFSDVETWVGPSSREVPTGIAIRLPEGFVGLIRPLPGRFWCVGGTVAEGPHKQELVVLLRTDQHAGIKLGQPVAQLLVVPTLRMQVNEA